MKRPDYLPLSALTMVLTLSLYSSHAHAASTNAVMGTNTTSAGLHGIESNESVATNAEPIKIVESQPQSRSNTKTVEEIKAERVASVTHFATESFNTMVNNLTSEKYLANRHLSASSTFPLRLQRKLSLNPWRPAPFLPVEEKDMACYYGIPPYRVPEQYDPNTTPINVSSNEVAGSIDSKISYSGDVLIRQADKNLHADEAVYDSTTGDIEVKGNVLYQAPEITLQTHSSIESNLNTKNSTIHDASFQLNGSIASGTAKKITLNEESKSSTIEKISFTTCPAGSNAWRIEAGSVELAQDESYGESYQNVLYIKDVPVAYLPYLNFPISNKRKSGLLYPFVSISSENGFDYAQPIYFNLAPNYDYTLTPRIMTNRGLLLGNEFRYMPWANTQGKIVFDYLPNDSAGDTSTLDDKERYMFRWHNRSEFFDGDLSLLLDYQAVRNDDYNYLDDIGADGVQTTDDHLKQSLHLTYDRSSYNISAKIRDYQRLLPDEYLTSRPFALMPQVTGQYYETFGPFTFDVQGELTKFRGSQEDNSAGFTTDRIHFEPSVNYQMFNSRGTSVSAMVRGFFTHYEQDTLESMPNYYSQNLGFQNLSDKTRSLYLVQLRASTTLERKIWDLRHTQTLEPTIQYQYIPYENQDDIALYDSTDRMSDYYSNFSFRHFTGKDRIADLNNITFGLTSRILDAHDRELMRFGISQTRSIVPTRVTLNPNDPQNLYPRSPLSLFFNATPIPEMTMHAGLSYTNETNSISSWNAMTRYQNEHGYMVQVGYRFARDGNRSISNNIIDLRQIGIAGKVPLGNGLSATIASYRDMEQEKNIDTKVSLKYEECCWSIALVYENYNQVNWDTLDNESGHNIGIQFEFKGVGTVNITGSNDRDYTNTRLLNTFDPTNLSR